jgi:lysophospholipase L1-like esterase
LRSVEPDYVPLITGNHWPTTWSHCRQAYTGGVQNYIPGVRLQGSLHISPAITADGKLRIAKATLTSQSPASVALAACIYPYSLYTAENNNSDTVSQFVSDYTSGGKLPTDEFAARTAPNVNCGVPATKLVTDAPTLALNPADSANGYTTSADGTRVSVAGDISVQNVSADIVIGDVDGPPAAPPVGDAYLGLGDSIAYGYNAAQFAAQYPAINPASFNYGYVDLFGSYLTGHYPSITTVQNDGCPGETTNSLLNGFNPAASLCGKGSGFPYAFLHHNYGVNNSQLQSAQAFLTAHPNAVVSLDIGANDLLDFLQITCGFGTISYSPSCVSSGMQPKFNQITANLNSIVTALQTTAPNARLIVMGLYNPYPGALSVGAIGGDTAVAQLNSLMRGVAVAHGARFVDPLSTFNPAGYRGLAESGDVPTICALTGMCPGGTYNPASPLADIHPSKKGYQALADLFRSASGL